MPCRAAQLCYGFALALREPALLPHHDQNKLTLHSFSLPIHVGRSSSGHTVGFLSYFSNADIQLSKENMYFTLARWSSTPGWKDIVKAKKLKEMNGNSGIKWYTEKESEWAFSSTPKHTNIVSANENCSNNLKCMHIRCTYPMHLNILTKWNFSWKL